MSDDDTFGAAAVLMSQRGQGRAAALMLDVTAVRFVKQMTDYEETMDYTSWAEHEDVILEVEPHLVISFQRELVHQIRSALEAVGDAQGRIIGDVLVREVIPRVDENWRNQLPGDLKGGKQSNQARQARLEPEHPYVDSLHLTNEWEHKVYQVLKERQASLPDNDTLAIIPLPGVRVEGHTFEPDLLITYRGRAGVIEVDGPHHKDRASADKGRERLLRNAGIKYIDRLDVRDSTQKHEVEKFVTDFLKHLSA